MSLSTAVVVGMIIVLAISALLTVILIVRGPSIMDRAVANEVLVSTIVCALGLEAAITRDTSTLPILISISLIGFLSSVVIARFTSKESDGVSIPAQHVWEAHEIDGLPQEPGKVAVTDWRRAPLEPGAREKR